VAGGQVDDAQAPGGEPDAVGEKKAFVVRAAMNDLVVHPFQGPGIGLIPELKKTAYSAHG
jgi:hypothetical protein